MKRGGASISQITVEAGRRQENSAVKHLNRMSSVMSSMVLCIPDFVKKYSHNYGYAHIFMPRQE